MVCMLQSLEVASVVSVAWLGSLHGFVVIVVIVVNVVLS